jgi:hypothetical protein
LPEDNETKSTTEGQKIETLYLSSVFKNQDEYFDFLDKINPLFKSLNFYPKPIKDLEYKMEFPTYVGENALLTTLLLKNPRQFWMLIGDGDYSKNKTYSSVFFRDYFLYLFITAGVRQKSIGLVSKLFIKEASSADKKSFNNIVLKGGKKIEAPPDYFKRFIADWYMVNNIGKETTKKQIQSLKKQIYKIAKTVSNFKLR